jgi:hypothetical protein
LCTAHLINAVREITHEWGSFHIRSLQEHGFAKKVLSLRFGFAA